MTKTAAETALRCLEGQAVLNWEATVQEKNQARADARRIRRFLNAERQEILILRRWVLLAADRLEDAFNGSDTSDSLITELRKIAKPRGRKT